ncbi:MAG TPA: zinc-dependent metalloprotease [Solirubrobacteraceae bacterium]|jgi:uncharacterized protein (DUF2342 family)|nr:zinc-dependent metalloprotease [Solirubrobacteraceae bacterium]
MDAIDWTTAQRIGELVAGAGARVSTPAGVRADAVEPRAHEFAMRVSAYSGLPLHGALPQLELVDRPSWIAANLQTMRPMLAPLSERLAEQSGRLAGPMRSVSGLLLGVQVGALTGMLSQRVLGQYDVSLLDPAVEPRLLLLAPNLSQAAATLEVDREELLLWVTIHEITHAVQFSGAPWLRGHIGGMLTELLEGLQMTLGGRDADGSANGNGTHPPSGSRGGLAGWLPDPGELREMLERARRGEVLRLTLGEDRWRLVERMQATMSLIEGHAEHTMDAVGAEVLPSLPRLRAAMTRRRAQRGLPWRVLEKLLGLELKMRQYEVGRRFCDAVVEAGGPETLALVWRGPEALPSTQELEQPALWTARMTPAAA